MSAPKDVVKSLFCCNGRLNDWFYKTFSRQSEIDGMLDECRKIDSLMDVSGLKELRRKIDRESLRFYTTDANKSNQLIYGIWESMFGGRPDTPVYCTPGIEHGLIFHDQIFTDVRFTARAGYVTFGDYRRDVIRRYKKVPVFCVGPYIRYATPYYEPDKTAELKRSLGSTLLVMPAHATDKGTVTRDERVCISNVAKIAKGYNSVLVNCFWWDINSPFVDAFKAEGYRIVSAGFRDDPLFLSRLKSLIEIADLVVGDSMGTHVGYALALDTPFCYLPLETKLHTLDSREKKSERAAKARTAKLASVFENSRKITNGQLEAIEPYWGLSHLRTRDEIDQISLIVERIATEAHFWTERYSEQAYALLEEYSSNDEVKFRLLREALR